MTEATPKCWFSTCRSHGRRARAAALLVKAAVGWARTDNRRLTPLCPFAHSVFEKTPDYRDVLA
jgi:predicted GNAT family acetyltransferase